jgi:hypothetical protein
MSSSNYKIPWLIDTIAAMLTAHVCKNPDGVCPIILAIISILIFLFFLVAVRKKNFSHYIIL